MLAGTQTQIDDVVGRANRLLVVLDDNHRVAEIAEPCEGREQGAIVALVQANRRLIEHVQHAGEVRADLRGEADTLPSPPDSVAALRPSVRYPTPTSFKK